MKLYLIDGYGFIYRAFHSLPPLTTPTGKPIGAIYGLTNMLVKFLAQHSADAIAVVLDSAEKTFRHKIYEQYKAHRPPPPAELIEQLPITREAIKAFNIVSIVEPGFEADDLIATYASLATKSGYEVVIVSSDKDLMQLVSDKVCMYDAMKDKYIKTPEVIEKFGVPPELVVDMLSLIGDSSDNIPGIHGIGPKTAAELLNNYGSLDNIFHNTDSITNPRRKTMLQEGKTNALLSRELVKLDHNAPIKHELASLKLTPPNNNVLLNFLAEMGFKSLLNKLKTIQHDPELLVQSPPEAAYKEITYTKIHSLKDIPNFEKVVYNLGQISLLYKSDSLQISLGDQHFESTASAPAQADLFASPEQPKASLILHQMKHVLEDASITKICFDAKLLIKDLGQQMVSLNNYIDIALMAYATGAARISCTETGLLAAYAPEVSHLSSAILEPMKTKILKDLMQNRGHAVFYKMDTPFLKVIAHIEERGVKVDLPTLKALSVEFSNKVKSIEQKIFQIAGCEFNVGSPKQLGEILFETLGIPGGKKSKLGAYSTGVDILENLADQGHEIASLVLEWRHFSKLISTYTEALPKSISPTTHRVHTSFNLTITSTGRLSSQEPNLQNIPIRTEEGQRIREAFIAEPGNVIVSADYSQIELRLLAHMASIPELQKAFRDNIDIHSVTASQMFGVNIADVNSELRRKAKTINFGIIYGISAFGLAKRLDIPNQLAKDYIEFYFKQYPGIKEYMSKMISFARSNGFVETLFGRRCYINGINDRNFALRGFAERAAINAPLQGTAADIIKRAMILIPEKYSRYLILQIHDELLFEAPEALADELMLAVKKIMEAAAHLSVPLTVDVSKGKSWAKAH